ncbi:uncharacterized protein LOC135568447, partial [Oncorhynchus nerka]|uniref:uncharacterized protein LOC135568447 n=1 Tax=Oncorhynchus nerka TaxID=8023 RepID=UPI0031B83B7A
MTKGQDNGQHPKAPKSEPPQKTNIAVPLPVQGPCTTGASKYPPSPPPQPHLQPQPPPQPHLCLCRSRVPVQLASQNTHHHPHHSPICASAGPGSLYNWRLKIPTITPTTAPSVPLPVQGPCTTGASKYPPSPPPQPHLQPQPPPQPHLCLCRSRVPVQLASQNTHHHPHHSPICASAGPGSLYNWRLKIPTITPTTAPSVPLPSRVPVQLAPQNTHHHPHHSPICASAGPGSLYNWRLKIPTITPTTAPSVPLPVQGPCTTGASKYPPSPPPQPHLCLCRSRLPVQLAPQNTHQHPHHSPICASAGPGSLYNWRLKIPTITPTTAPSVPLPVQAPCTTGAKIPTITPTTAPSVPLPVQGPCTTGASKYPPSPPPQPHLCLCRSRVPVQLAPQNTHHHPHHSPICASAGPGSLYNWRLKIPTITPTTAPSVPLPVQGPCTTGAKIPPSHPPQPHLCLCRSRVPVQLAPQNTHHHPHHSPICASAGSRVPVQLAPKIPTITPTTAPSVPLPVQGPCTTGAQNTTIPPPQPHLCLCRSRVPVQLAPKIPTITPPQPHLQPQPHPKPTHPSQKPFYHKARPNYKVADWNIEGHTPTLIIGDSNLNRVPPFNNPNIQVDSYPGATFYHFIKVLEKTPIHTDTATVVISVGLNNKDHDPFQTSLKQLA